MDMFGACIFLKQNFVNMYVKGAPSIWYYVESRALFLNSSNYLQGLGREFQSVDRNVLWALGKHVSHVHFHNKARPMNNSDPPEQLYLLLFLSAEVKK